MDESPGGVQTPEKDEPILEGMHAPSWNVDDDLTPGSHSPSPDPVDDLPRSESKRSSLVVDNEPDTILSSPSPIGISPSENDGHGTVQ